MQNYIDQAIVNGVEIVETGPCQFCGAKVQNGITACLNIYNNSIIDIGKDDPDIHTLRFLCVDAHALQHPEIHGRWSNHFHLTRLYLLVENKINWDYKKSPILSTHINRYKRLHLEEILQPPPIGRRGAITSLDISLVKDSPNFKTIVHKWAEEVLEA